MPRKPSPAAGTGLPNSSTPSADIIDPAKRRLVVEVIDELSISEDLVDAAFMAVADLDNGRERSPLRTLLEMTHEKLSNTRGKLLDYAQHLRTAEEEKAEDTDAERGEDALSRGLNPPRAASTFEALYLRAMEKHAELNLMMEAGCTNKDSEPLIAECSGLRAEIARFPIRSVEDFWLKAEFAFAMARGVSGIMDEVHADLGNGNATDTTLQAMVLADLMTLRHLF